MDRVPEGNALTNIALNLYCFDTKVQLRSMLKSAVRSGLHYFLPTFVSPVPQGVVGRPEYTMSDVYDMAINQGTLEKHRAINLRIRQEFFEKEMGMVKEKPKSSILKYALGVVPVAACAVAIFVKYV
mmetsp:Transcript_13553/g.29468  ORF Transcript_13553/g.29468 Transcript_13553/m.29468 type:complete len:127 (+) Transcript_13553:1327-1707(+)